jgi:predicted GH43/DUF377 family glycosyl hydrolase
MTYGRRRNSRDVVHRWEGNPLITIADLDFRCSDIRNAGAVNYNGEELLLVDIEHLSGVQSIHLARPSKNTRFKVEKEPFMSASTDRRFAQHESWGTMDPRITYLENVYYITYLANGDHGFRIGLAKTSDFKSVERIGLISEPDTKGGALFPSKINGKYARLERPREGQSIWVSYSEDLRYWGGSRTVLSPRGGFWDTSRIGIGPPPIEIDAGWLLIYYGAKDTSAGPLYRLGAAIVNKDDPTIVLGRANIPILAPRENYERLGDTPNIVYSTGALVKDDGCIVLYYGAADSCICMGVTTIAEIIANCPNLREETSDAI